MKQLIPFLLFIFLSFQMQAQCELSAGPNPYEKTFEIDVTNPNALGTCYASFFNDSDEVVQVKWDIIVDADCPDEWQYQVCDNNNCYLFGVHSNWGGPVNVPVELAPGDSSILQLKIHM